MPAAEQMTSMIPVVVGGGVVMEFSKAAFPGQRRQRAQMRRSARRRTARLSRAARRRTKAVRRAARRRSRTGLGYGDFSNLGF